MASYLRCCDGAQPVNGTSTSKHRIEISMWKDIFLLSIQVHLIRARSYLYNPDGRYQQELIRLQRTVLCCFHFKFG